MELGLSLGDKPSKTSDGFTKNGVVTTVVSKASDGLGFCMGLGINPTNGATHQHKEKPQIQGDRDEDDDEDEDGEAKSFDNREILKENNGIREVIVYREKVSSLNPPVQLDLLPCAPVPRQAPFPWSSDNGSSEGGSSGNAAATRGLDVNRIQAAVGTEEATSSFRLDFPSYKRIGNVNGGTKNHHKRGLELGNDVVEVERASSRASDEDENGVSRKKLRLSKEQSAYLEESFKEHNTLNPQQKLALAEHLNLRPRQVEVWFQNRRARTKLKQTEVDYEYLKRCCETLTEENRRLHKELQELRALKTTSNPFYMQLPATTLTMCPSCEHVATTAATTPLPSSVALTKPTEPTLPSSAKPRSLTYPTVSHASQCNSSDHLSATPS